MIPGEWHRITGLLASDDVPPLALYIDADGHRRWGVVAIDRSSMRLTGISGIKNPTRHE